MKILTLSELKRMLYSSNDPLIEISDRSAKTNISFISKIFYDGGILTGSDRDYLLDTANRPRLSAFMQGRAFTQMSNKIGIDWFLRETISRFLRNTSSFLLFDQNLDQYLTRYNCKRAYMRSYILQQLDESNIIMPEELNYHLKSLLSSGSVETAFSWLMLLAFFGPDNISLLSGSWYVKPKSLFFPASAFSYYASDGKEDTVFSTQENLDSYTTVNVTFEPCRIRPDIPAWASMVILTGHPLDLSNSSEIHIIFNESPHSTGLSKLKIELKNNTHTVPMFSKIIPLNQVEQCSNTVSVSLNAVDHQLLSQVCEICLVIQSTFFSNPDKLNCVLKINGFKII